MSDDGATLTVLTAVESRMRGPGDQDKARRLLEKGIPLDTLRQNFAGFLGALQQIFMDVEENVTGDFVLDEVTFSAEIGGNGEFKLMGTGVGVSASSGVTFTLRRQKSGMKKEGTATKI